MIQSLTYAELAEALRITPESANRLARRRRWPRSLGNDGKVRVTVPEGVLVRADSPPVSPPDCPPVNPVHALQARIAGLEGELTGVRMALAEARARADAAEARHAYERDQADRAREQLAAVADRLMALAINQRRPWWRRLVG